MFEKLSELWEDYGFEILVGLSILAMIIIALFRMGKKGTWARTVNYTSTQPKKRRPPTESKGEVECRRVLEEIFRAPFAKARPDFLNNPVTGGSYNLELDCYNPHLRLAVEYNGVQHYKYVPYFHKNKDAFMNQKYRDELKRRMCKDNRIHLIEVPHTVKTENIKAYIISALRRTGYI